MYQFLFGSPLTIIVYCSLLVNAIIEEFPQENGKSSRLFCGEKQFRCDNGQCIDAKKHCNRRSDCKDGSDETECDLVLCEKPRYFRCANGRCVSSTFLCNGDNDCEDYSDEKHCPNQTKTIVACTKDEWRCLDGRCIPQEWVCNMEADCADASDETIACSKRINCDGFQCGNGFCILKEWQCDGQDDCRDGSDEICDKLVVPVDQCTLDRNRYQCSDNETCISVVNVCNGQNDCPDGSDEGGQCTNSTNCATLKCQQKCVHLPSGANCFCTAGFTAIGNRCKDVNECHNYGVCVQKCRNTVGSHECYCSAGYRLQSDGRSCRAIEGEALLLFSSKNQIRAYLLQSKVYFPVASQLKLVLGVDFDGRHVYWTDIYAEHETIARSLRNGSQQELLVTSGLGTPEDLSIDWITGNIYFTDSERRHIGVCTNDGTKCTVLVTEGMHKPRAIALHPTKGQMFWSDWGKVPEIAMAHMDGTNDISFVSNRIHWPNGLTIDYANERLYWTDGKLETLESIRLDGTDRRIILEKVARHPYSIAVFESDIYWSDWETHSIQACNKFTGKNHRTLIKSKQGENIYGIRVYHPAQRAHFDNPCTRAYCSDICLLTVNNNSRVVATCTCPQDTVLSANMRTCKATNKKQTLILALDNLLIHVEHQMLGKHVVMALPVQVKQIGALAYNSLQHTLYISDVALARILRLNLHVGTVKTLISDNIGRVNAMDFDYFGNNLYWIDSIRDTVEVLNLNTMSRRVLLRDMEGEIPESIALVPTEGVMFVAFRRLNGIETHIDRMNMDGTHRVHSLESGLSTPVALLYDSDLNRVFVADGGTGNIETTSTDGDDRHGFRSLQTAPVSIASLRNDLFWMDAHSARIYWTDKYSSNVLNAKLTLDVGHRIENVHIVATTPPRILSSGVGAVSNSNSACRINNGNCSHLCLLSGKEQTVCACPVGYIALATDAHHCIEQVYCASDEFQCAKSNMCIESAMRCNGITDCLYDEDEMNCPRMAHPDDAHNCTVATGRFRCANGQCISGHLRCNMRRDCADGSDEVECETPAHQCSANQVQCSDIDTDCIPISFLCNGANDCTDGSDEFNCSTSTCDVRTQFRCLTGACIPKEWECDHEFDCSDNSDEHTRCNKCADAELYACSNGRCIDRALVCNQQDDCFDGSDERNCADSYACTLDGYQCLSAHGTQLTSMCLPAEGKCNGTADCPLGDDEMDCECRDADEFQCSGVGVAAASISGHKCIPREWVCDNTDDCVDGSDEHNCHNHSHQRVNSSGSANVKCDGAATFQCGDGQCIDRHFACNGHNDCFDGSDEGGVCVDACAAHEKQPCEDICQATPNGAQCYCHPGRRLLGNGHSCRDVDECREMEPPVCSQKCHNSIGSYRCDCFSGFQLRNDKRSCKAEGQPLTLVYTVNAHEIRELSQQHNSLRVVYEKDEIPPITGLDVNVRNGAIYMSLADLGVLVEWRKDGGNRTFPVEAEGRPEIIVFDWIAANLYYVDQRLNTLGVCNIQSGRCASNLIQVGPYRKLSALAVDPNEQWLFYGVTSWRMFNAPTFSVRRCRLDGTASAVLAPNLASVEGALNALTLDPYQKRVYYVSSRVGRIWRVNYDGTLNTLALQLDVKRYFAVQLRLFEDHLCVLMASGEMAKCALYEMKRDACSYFALNGPATSSAPTNLMGVVTDLFAVDQISSQPIFKLKNQCLSTNSCSHLCLATEPSPKYRCVCADGRNESDDNRQCRHLVENSNTNKSMTANTTRTNITRTVERDGGGGGGSSGGRIAAAVLIPICLALLCACAYYAIRRQRGAANGSGGGIGGGSSSAASSSRFDVAMRFRNPAYNAHIEDENSESRRLEFENPLRGGEGDGAGGSSTNNSGGDDGGSVEVVISTAASCTTGVIQPSMPPPNTAAPIKNDHSIKGANSLLFMLNL